MDHRGLGKVRLGVMCRGLVQFEAHVRPQARERPSRRVSARPLRGRDSAQYPGCSAARCTAVLTQLINIILYPRPHPVNELELRAAPLVGVEMLNRATARRRAYKQDGAVETQVEHNMQGSSARSRPGELKLTTGCSLARLLACPLARLLVILMFASSASWASPYSYQFNLMVFDVGQYTLKDYVVFGEPMHI
jgi:hypothetical protein